MHVKRAVAAGMIGTGVLTALWLVEPSIGLPRIAVGQILSTFMSVSVAHLRVGATGGWIAHFMVGIVFALLYAWRLADRLAGPSLRRGALFGAILFVLAQCVFMPLVGAGFFARGNVELLAGSLIGHLAYGIVTAWIYDLPHASGPSVVARVA
jgi:Predicted periplasmic/secreted protein